MQSWLGQGSSGGRVINLSTSDLGAVHTKIDLSSLLESVHTHLDRSWIDLSSHLSVHIQIALDLDRSQIDLTH